MDVNSVSKPAVHSTTAVKRPMTAQSEHRSENQQKVSEASRTPEPKPRPVVNSQGQVTGRHLNVSA